MEMETYHGQEGEFWVVFSSSDVGVDEQDWWSMSGPTGVGSERRSRSRHKQRGFCRTDRRRAYQVRSGGADDADGSGTR